MGLDTLSGLIDRSSFPWLLSNVFDAETLEPLLNIKTREVVVLNGIKVDYLICFL